MRQDRAYNFSIRELTERLGVDLDKGLNKKEVKERLSSIGFNKLPSKDTTSFFSLLMDQFNDFMILVLIGAIIISAFLGEFADAIAILVIVILNAVMGFVQEYRAERSLQALKRLSAPHAKVLRGGEIEDVLSEELVPGDIILLETGNKIPADGRVIESNSLEVNESSLTGESVPVIKRTCDFKSDIEVALGDRNNMIHMGTIVTKGRGKAIITATGLNTEMGRIANLLQQTEENITPLQRRLRDLGQWLVLLCLLACAAVVGLGVIKGEPLYKMFLSGVSLAVAAIPEGLPAVVTLSLAIGVQRMISRNAIVRKLPAVETLGCATVICSDKTGTLTKNEMTVQQIYTNDKVRYCQAEGFAGQQLKKALEIATICNNAQLKESNSLIGRVKDNILNDKKAIGDPTEVALLMAAKEAGLNKKQLREKFIDLVEIPFDSNRKRMSVIGKKNEEYQLFIKGAPDILLDRCSGYLKEGKVKKIGESKKRELLEMNRKMAGQALRVLAVGYRKLGRRIDKDNLERYEDEIIFVGLIGMIDPPRVEVAEAISRCKQAGIMPKMVTGDHKNTAIAIAKELRLFEPGDKVITGQELAERSDEELAEEINGITVFARVSPQDKLRIVNSLKDRGHIVAMTGDGVNDAPAIKRADIGISMGKKGTDVTQEASSLILADDNFSTIIAAIEEGRAIYDNIRKFIRYLLSCNIGEILTMFLTSLLGLPLPLIPIQILWINLITDGLPALALGVDPADDDIMQRPPRQKDESIFAHGLKWRIISKGILIGLGSVFVFLFSLRYTDSLIKARTMVFTNLVMSQLFFVFSCRSEDYSLFMINPFSNIYLMAAVLFSFGMHLSVLYIPFLSELFKITLLVKGEWAIILLVSGGTTLFVELIQFIINLFRSRISFIGFEESM